MPVPRQTLRRTAASNGAGAFAVDLGGARPVAHRVVRPPRDARGESLAYAGHHTALSGEHAVWPRLGSRFMSL